MRRQKVSYRYPYAYRIRRQVKTSSPLLERRTSITPLDICKKRRLISDEEFFAANFFISLYRLRYGDIFTRAKNYAEPRDKYRGILSDKWYEERNSLYFAIIRKLGNKGAAQNVINICVFEQFPDFLKSLSPNKKTLAQIQQLKYCLKIIFDIISKRYSLNTK